MRIDVLDADTLARVGWVDVWVSLYWDLSLIHILHI